MSLSTLVPGPASQNTPTASEGRNISQGWDAAEQESVQKLSLSLRSHRVLSVAHILTATIASASNRDALCWFSVRTLKCCKRVTHRQVLPFQRCCFHVENRENFRKIVYPCIWPMPVHPPLRVRAGSGSDQKGRNQSLRKMRQIHHQKKRNESLRTEAKHVHIRAYQKIHTLEYTKRYILRSDILPHQIHCDCGS